MISLTNKIPDQDEDLYYDFLMRKIGMVFYSGFLVHVVFSYLR